MKLLTGVIYDAKPEDVVVYPTSVMVTVSCEEIQVTDETSDEASTKFQCDVEVYEVYEYIAKVSSVANTANATANQALDVAQVSSEYAEAAKVLLGEE